MPSLSLHLSRQFFGGRASALCGRGAGGERRLASHYVQVRTLQTHDHTASGYVALLAGYLLHLLPNIFGMDDPDYG